LPLTIKTLSVLCASLGASMALLDNAQAAAKPVPRRFDVIEYGAVGDGHTLDTVAVLVLKRRKTGDGS
jgi:hypothetical protein